VDEEALAATLEEADETKRASVGQQKFTGAL